MAKKAKTTSETIWERRPGGSRWDIVLDLVSPDCDDPKKNQVWLSIGIPKGGAIQIDLKPDELIELGLVMVKAGNDLKKLGV